MNVYTFAPSNARQLSGTAFSLSQALREGCANNMAVTNVRLAPYTELRIAQVMFMIKNLSVSARRGFALSSDYLTAAYASTGGAKIEPSDWFICFQPLAPSQISKLRSQGRCKIATYIDFSLSEYLRSYEINATIPGRVKDKLCKSEVAAFRLYDRIFVFDEVSRSIIIKEFGLDAEKVISVGRGVNLSEDERNGIADARAKKQHGKVLNFVFIGKDFKRKGLLEVISAMDNLAALHAERFKLHVIGPDIDKIPTRSYITSYGVLDRIHDQAIFRQVLGLSDFGVMLSEAEGGVPSGILEYLASGIPAIVTDLPRIKHVLNGNSVIFVDKENRTSAFQRVLEDLLTGDIDHPELAAKAAREMDAFSWRKVAENIIGEMRYDELISLS